MIIPTPEREQQILERLLTTYARRYSGKVRGLTNNVIRRAADLYKETGIDFDPLLAEEYKERLLAFSKQNTDAVIPRVSNRLFRQIGQQVDEIDRIDNVTFTTFLKEDWANNFALVNSQLVTDTTFNQLQNVIQNGIRQELGRAEIVKNLLATQKLTKHRARTIAWTETHQASTFANQKTAERIEVETGARMQKIWAPKLDSRTRDPHAAMVNHPPIGLKELFEVGGEFMDRPGDSSHGAGPANVINCRCAVKYKVLR